MPPHRCASALVAEALRIVCTPSPVQTLLFALSRAVRNTLTSASCLGGFRMLQTCLCQAFFRQISLINWKEHKGSEAVFLVSTSGLCLKPSTVSDNAGGDSVA